MSTLPDRAAPAALLLLLAPLTAACSGGSAEPPSADARADVGLPDPAEAGLVSPEEAQQAAQEAIDASNAEDELERLRREIGEG